MAPLKLLILIAQKGSNATLSIRQGLAVPCGVYGLVTLVRRKHELLSESDRLCRAVGSGSLTLEGRPEIMADQPLLLQGFRGQINGPWKAATVTHCYEKQSGYTTEITLETPDKGNKTREKETSE